MSQPSNQGNSFLSQLLGLNQDHPAQLQAAAQAHLNNPSLNGGVQAKQGSTPPSGWNSAFRRLKLSDALQGINITPNFMFLVLFVGFTAWLGVVYWVRHHEPLANSVLGTAAAHSATAYDDRRLVAGIKKTLPVRTSHSSGEFYVPIPNGNQILHSGQFGNAQHNQHMAAYSGSAAYATPNAAAPLPAPPFPPAPTPYPEPTPLHGYNGLQAHNGYGGLQAAPATQPYQIPSNPHAYMVPVSASAGTRVKMIVNR